MALPGSKILVRSSALCRPLVKGRGNSQSRLADNRIVLMAVEGPGLQARSSGFILDRSEYFCIPNEGTGPVPIPS